MPIYKGQEIMQRILEQESTRMMSELTTIREKFHQGGNRGHEAEATLREFLRRYLPVYNHVGHGEVFNKDGRRSRQTDIIVTNEEHPPLYNDWERAHSFIIEGVAAGGEVKTALQSASDLRDAFDKGMEFKRVLAQPQPKSIVHATNEDIRRFVNRRPFFAFFFESKVEIEAIKHHLEQWETELRDVERPIIDAVFVLSTGSIINFGQGDGVLSVRLSDGTNARGYQVEPEPKDRVLPSLLLWMFTSMPRMKMWVPPIVDYLLKEEDVGPLTMTDDGTMRRPTQPKRVL